MKFEEIENRDMWAREFFIPRRWWLFHWGRYQLTMNGKWRRYFEIWIGKDYFIRF